MSTGQGAHVCLPLDVKRICQVRGVAQWQDACLACARPWLSCPVPQEKRTGCQKRRQVRALNSLSYCLEKQNLPRLPCIKDSRINKPAVIPFPDSRKGQVQVQTIRSSSTVCSVPDFTPAMLTKGKEQ